MARFHMPDTPIHPGFPQQLVLPDERRREMIRAADTNASTCKDGIRFGVGDMVIKGGKRVEKG